MIQPAAIPEMLRRVRMDLTDAQGKLTDLIAAVDKLDLEQTAAEHDKRTKCEQCGLRFPGPRTLAEHAFVSHSGPVPEHYTAIETRALESEPA